jgi:hypothetical protein
LIITGNVTQKLNNCEERKTLFLGGEKNDFKGVERIGV